MGIVLYRVDERLIHGQVVVGWGGRLRPNRIVVVDDELSRSAWEQELYAVGVPYDVEAEFLDVKTAEERLQAWQSSGERVLLLTRDIHTMSRLAESGKLRGAEVNIGGIHHAPGRRQVLRYVYLSDTEKQELETLSGMGVKVMARDLPSAKGVGLDELVRTP